MEVNVPIACVGAFLTIFLITQCGLQGTIIWIGCAIFIPVILYMWLIQSIPPQLLIKLSKVLIEWSFSQANFIDIDLDQILHNNNNSEGLIVTELPNPNSQPEPKPETKFEPVPNPETKTKPNPGPEPPKFKFPDDISENLRNLLENLLEKHHETETNT